jgi:hypothetical protein
MGTVAFSSNTPITDKGDRASRAFWKVIEEVLKRTGGASDAFYAVDVIFDPSGDLTSTTVQDALEELDTEKQPKDATLTALAALVTAADRLVYATGVDAFALTTFTAYARTLLDDADAATARSTLGLVIGTDVQAYDAELAAIAGLASAADQLPYFTGAGTASLATFTAAGRALVDDADAAAQRATLGLVIGANVQAWDAELDTWATKTAPSGTVVGTSDAQTLSAKELATPVVTGTEYTEQGAVTSKAAAATLTIAELLTRIIQYTGAADNLTLPTGANIEAGVLAGLANDRAFDFSVINTGSGTATILTAAGLTLVGAMAVTAGASGQFRVRKTATNTYTVYRIA